MDCHGPNTHTHTHTHVPWTVMVLTHTRTHSCAMVCHVPNAHTHVPWAVMNLTLTLMCHGMFVNTHGNLQCAVGSPASPQQLLFPMLVQCAVDSPASPQQLLFPMLVQCTVDCPASPQQLLFPMLVQPSDQLPSQHVTVNILSRPVPPLTQILERSVETVHRASRVSDTMTAFFHCCFLQTERHINIEYGAQNKGNIALCNQELNSGMLGSERTL
jgi:hypothetical protein